MRRRCGCSWPTASASPGTPRQCLADARALIAKHRRAVEAVADALLERETLSAAEIDQLMMERGSGLRALRR